MFGIRDFHRDHHQLFFEYESGGLRFTNSLWYHDCDFFELEQRYGEATLRNIYFHIGAFEVNKLASLGMEPVTFGPFADLVTDEFASLWSQIVHKVWAQWRFENGRPFAAPPSILDPPRPSESRPAEVKAGPQRYLAFCGGGKDSLVSSRLLEHAGVAYDSFVYASSIYGDLAAQHRLIDGLVEHLGTSHVRRLSLFDDFLQSPVLALEDTGGVRTLTAAETPSSLFEALPLVLQHGYRYLVLGHERSADVGNLIWQETGEDVNHQWGKSTEAETLLAAYIADHLVGDCTFFSILKPINDVTIFSLLAEEPFEVVATTHSCNVAKPWCRRCPKCVYVWLNYLAYLDAESVRALFGENLFETPANERDLRMMAGLGEHTPFECIGQVEESRLALDRCRAKGLSGSLLDGIARMTAAERDAAIARFTQVDDAYPGLPDEIRSAVLGRQRSAAERVATDLRSSL
jgi:hypothetical protein